MVAVVYIVYSPFTWRFNFSMIDLHSDSVSITIHCHYLYVRIGTLNYVALLGLNYIVFVHRYYFLSLGAATARTCLAYSVTGNIRECSKVTVARVLDARWAEAFHVRFMDVDNRSRISHVTGGVQAPSSILLLSVAH